MSTIKINWGAKIAILYISFVVMMVALVVASTRQQFDLVSEDYYKQEIAYQDIIDATRNQAALSCPISLQLSNSKLEISFPPELAGQSITGTVEFYAPANAAHDKQFPIVVTDNKMIVERSALAKTLYKVKLQYAVGNKPYFQESEINLTH